MVLTIHGILPWQEKLKRTSMIKLNETWLFMKPSVQWSGQHFLSDDTYIYTNTYNFKNPLAQRVGSAVKNTY